MDSIFLSVIIPAYNEEVRLRRNLTSIYDFLEKQNFSFEVIIIDDGSIDNTSGAVKDFQNHRNNLILIENPGNKGKGYAVRIGMLRAKGNIRVFIDADLSVPIETISWLINFTKEGYDIVIASRNIPGAWVKIKQSLPRRLMGSFFKNLTNLMLTKNISDITCGTKSFTDKTAEKIFSIQRLDDWSFDAEILFLAKKYNFRIKEVPVAWSDRHHSKVRFPRDIFKSFLGLTKIKLFDLSGYYDRK